MREPFHNGVTPCPVCEDPVNFATQSIVRFPEILGPQSELFPERTGIYHRACFYQLPELAAITEAFEATQRACFTQRNHAQSLFNNVVAFDTSRFLCYRYLDSFEHQLFEFPRLVDWHLTPEQLRILYQFFTAFDEDTFAVSQQIFSTDFTFHTDPVAETVLMIRYWSLILPMTISDQDFIALGEVLRLDGDLSEKPQLVDFGHITEETGISDRSGDPEFISDHLFGELIGFQPSRIHEGMINLHIRIHPKDEIPLTLWEALELRENLLEYAEAQELKWESAPLKGKREDDVDESELPRWE